MIKQFAMLTKKPGMSFDAFVDRYENGHVPLIQRLVPFHTGYRRNFVVPAGGVGLGHVGGAAERPFFDVLTELTYDGPQKLKDLSAKLSDGSIADQIATDEAAFLDRSKMLMMAVDERSTPAERLQPRPAGHSGPPPIKQIALLKRKPGMTRDAFIEYYEKNHSELAMKILLRNKKPIFAGYKRNFPIPGGTFDMPHTSGTRPQFDYDVISEFWYWTQNDFQFFLDLCGERGIGAALELDESQFFDRSAINVFMADERITA